MPYLLPSSDMLRMYAIGFFHCSSEGLKVCASLTSPVCFLEAGGRGRLPLRSTESGFSLSERLALNGTGIGPFETVVPFADFDLAKAGGCGVADRLSGGALLELGGSCVCDMPLIVPKWIRTEEQSD